MEAERRPGRTEERNMERNMMDVDVMATATGLQVAVLTKTEIRPNTGPVRH